MEKCKQCFIFIQFLQIHIYIHIYIYINMETVKLSMFYELITATKEQLAKWHGLSLQNN